MIKVSELELDVIGSKERKDSIIGYRKISEDLDKKAIYFQSLGLNYESYLAAKLSLISKLNYSALTIRLEKAKNRIKGYNECSRIAGILENIEIDKERKKGWSGMVQYYNARSLVNEAIIGGFDRDMLKKAVDLFKEASNSCNEAYPCYCVYDALSNITVLSSEKIDLLDLKNRLSRTTKNMSEGKTKECLLKMQDAIGQGTTGDTIENILNELNNAIIDVEYDGLKQVLKIASREIYDYFQNPMEIKVDFQNWNLRISISGVEDKIRITLGENTLWEELVKRKIEFNLPFEPENKEEKINFEIVDRPYIKRQVPVKCCEIIDEHNVFFLKRSAS